jgi:hypothetical protein
MHWFSDAAKTPWARACTACPPRSSPDETVWMAACSGPGSERVTIWPAPPMRRPPQPGRERVARVERGETGGGGAVWRGGPDFAVLNPGYAIGMGSLPLARQLLERIRLTVTPNTGRKVAGRYDLMHRCLGRSDDRCPTPKCELPPSAKS